VLTAEQLAAASGTLREQAGVDVRDPARPSGQAWTDALHRVRRLPGAPSVAEPEPYRGLDSYGPDDASYYFGRERLVARLVALVTSSASAGPTVVVGPSGSGKSSALQAGLAARLSATGNWQVAGLTPGPRPMAVLEETLREIRERKLPPGSRIALLIDQFEELFTVCSRESERQAFVAAVTGPLNPGPGIGPAVTAVIALRAEFYGAALRFEPLSQSLQDRQVVVGPMAPVDLRRAVAEPARAAGLQVEPGLVELVLHDMAAHDMAAAAPDASSGGSSNGASSGGSSIGSRDAAATPGPDGAGPYAAGGLALMSYALLETWRRSRGSSRLTVEDYVAAGGIAGAVGAVADQTYHRLPATRRPLVRQLMLQLVAVGDQVPDGRRRATAARLGLDGPDGEGLAEVLERFVAARLLTTGETTVEIAHEALLTGWPRLRGWLDAERTGEATHRRLGTSASAWQRDGRDRSQLARGADLLLAREWAADPAHANRIRPLEREFLEASHAAHDTEATGGRRRVARLRALLVGSTAVALVAGGLAVGQSSQRSAAVTERDNAVSVRLADAASRLRDVDPTVAAQFAVQAWRTGQTVQARSALLDSSALPLAFRLAGPSGARALAAGGDGRLLAVVGDRGELRLYTTSGRSGPAAAAGPAADPVAVTTAPDGRPLNAVAIGRDGAVAMAGGDSGALHVWRLDAGRPAALPDLAVGHGVIGAMALSPDGHTLAAGTGDGHLALFDVQGSTVKTLGTALDATAASAVQAVGFSADGKVLAAAGTSGRVLLWTLADRTAPAAVAVQLAGSGASTTSVCFSPDGKQVLAGSADQHAYLWQLANPTATPARFDGAAGAITTAGFSPDGGQLLIGGADHRVRVYDAGSHGLLAELPHPAAVTAAGYLPDSRTVVTAADDGMVRLWPALSPAASMPAPRTVALGYLDGTRLAAVAGRDALQVFDVATRYRPHPLGAPVAAPAASRAMLSGAMAVGPGGSPIAAGGSDGEIWLFEPASPNGGGSAPTQLVGTVARTQKDAVTAVALSPDGHTLVAASNDGTLQITDVTTPASPRPSGPLVPARGVRALAFSPDGALLAVGTADPPAVQLWNLRDRAHPTPLGAPVAGPARPVYSLAFAPAGSVLAVGSADHTVRLLDASDPRTPRWTGTPLDGGADTVYAVGFGPDGATLSAAGGDGTARVWSLGDHDRPTVLATLTAARTRPLYALDYQPGGSTLAAAGDGNAVLQWDLNPATALDRVCAASGPAMTAAEWSHYLPDVPFAKPCG
jgi:WD40 repeat protein